MPRNSAKRPTIADIAQRAGVSKVAVSYALNGQSGVSEATRKRIIAIAEEIGFSPSSAARALTGAAAQAVGLVLSRPARTLGLEPFFMELISGVEAVLSARSYALTLQVVADPLDEIVLYKRWRGERRIDGVLVCDLRDDDPRIPALEELDLPAVVIGGPGHVGRLANIWSDDAAAVVETVEYLYALGHRRIARVGGMPQFLHTRIRTDAFNEVGAKLGLTQATSVVSDYSGEDGARVTRRLLSSAQRPTAIIYDNDVMAIAGLGRRAGDGALGARRRLDRRLGRLGAVPPRPPAADRAAARHPGLRRTRGDHAAVHHRRSSRRRGAGSDGPARPAGQHRAAAPVVAGVSTS